MRLKKSNIIIPKQKIVTSILYARTIKKDGGTFVEIVGQNEKSRVGALHVRHQFRFAVTFASRFNPVLPHNIPQHFNIS